MKYQNSKTIKSFQNQSREKKKIDYFQRSHGYSETDFNSAAMKMRKFKGTLIV